MAIVAANLPAPNDHLCSCQPWHWDQLWP